jgi:hypothetical protein
MEDANFLTGPNVMKRTVYLTLLFFFTALHAQVVRKTTPAGNFIEYNFLEDERYTVKWGNNNLVRSSPETLYSHYGGARFKWENKDAVVIEDGCGTSCWYALLLPLDSASPMLQYNNPFAYDSDRSLIAYAASSYGRSHTLETASYDSSGWEDDTAIVVENFKTHRKRYFVAKDCHQTSLCCPSFCIVDVEFRGDSLYYRWSGSEDVDSRRTVWLGFDKLH